MKVTVKKFDVDMEVKSSGVDFEVRSTDGKKHLGNLTLNKTSLLWCPSKTDPKNATKMTWDKFIKLMTPEDSKPQTAIKPTKKPAKKTSKK